MLIGTFKNRDKTGGAKTMGKTRGTDLVVL